MNSAEGSEALALVRESAGRKTTRDLEKKGLSYAATLGRFVRAIPSPLPAELFKSSADHLSQVLGPIDRRTNFPATADAWKNIASTRAKRRKSLD